MRVSINQPYYLPWLGIFDRIRRSDLHIVLDHVTLEKGGYSNRTRIRQRDGRWMWLTIPVEKGKPINETRVADLHWRRKHAEALKQAYGIPEYLPAYMEGWPLTIEAVCRCTTRWLARLLDIDLAKFLSSKTLHVPGAKSDLILNLCKWVGATQYLSGAQGRNYLDIPAFEKAGIEVVYHEFPGDKPTLDYLFNEKERLWPQAHLTSAHYSQDSEAAPA